jgi:hypothetical protein
VSAAHDAISISSARSTAPRDARIEPMPFK